MREIYCRPLCYGTDSEPAAVGRRIGSLVMALDGITSLTCSGPILNHIQTFRAALAGALIADGWSIHYNVPGQKPRVIPPPTTLKSKQEYAWNILPAERKKTQLNPSHGHHTRVVRVEREGNEKWVFLTHLRVGELDTIIDEARSGP